MMRNSSIFTLPTGPSINSRVDEDSVVLVCFTAGGSKIGGISETDTGCRNDGGEATEFKWILFMQSLRFRISLLLCGAMFSMSFMSMSLGMAIICITNPQGAANLSQIRDTDGNGIDRLKNSFNCCIARVSWSPSIQGLILSSISWGRLFTPLAGIYCDRYNAKIIIAIGVFTASLSTALIPIFVNTSVHLIIALRVVTGLCDAAVQPSTSRFICAWFPEGERNIALTISTAGRQIAVLVAFPFAGAMCSQHQIAGGWPMVFYISALFALVWTPIWVFFSSQNPLKHRKIAPKEKVFLQLANNFQPLGKLNRVTPWRRILLSRVIWANIAAVMCHEIPLYIVFIFLPAYMRDVFNLPFAINGLVSALPAGVFLCTKILASHLAYICHTRGIIENASVLAKFFNGIASLCMGAMLIGVSFLDCSQNQLGLILISVGIGSAGFHVPGCINTLVMVAPSFSGTISGITFLGIGISALISPVIVRSVVTEGLRSEWNHVFAGIGSIAIFPIIFFTIWGSAEVQPWAMKRRDSNSPNHIENVIGNKRVSSVEEIS